MSRQSFQNIIYPMAIVAIIIGGILYSVPLADRPVITEIEKEVTTHVEILITTAIEEVYTESREVKQISKEIKYTKKRVRTTVTSTFTREEVFPYCQKYATVIHHYSAPINAEAVRTVCLDRRSKTVYKTTEGIKAYNTYITTPKTTVFHEYLETIPVQEISSYRKQVTLTQPIPTTILIPTTVIEKTKIESAYGIAYSLWIIGILLFITGLFLRKQVTN